MSSEDRRPLTSVPAPSQLRVKKEPSVTRLTVETFTATRLRGQFTAVVGGPMSGKSTLCRSLALAAGADKFLENCDPTACVEPCRAALIGEVSKQRNPSDGSDETTWRPFACLVPGNKDGALSVDLKPHSRALVDIRRVDVLPDAMLFVMTSDVNSTIPPDMTHAVNVLVLTAGLTCDALRGIHAAFLQSRLSSTNWLKSWKAFVATVNRMHCDGTVPVITLNDGRLHYWRYPQPPKQPPKRRNGKR